MKPVQLVYDGSFEGLLTCVFVEFEEKLEVNGISTTETAQNDLFAKNHKVCSDAIKAERVLKAIKKKFSPTQFNRIYYSFLSELPDIDLEIYHFLRKAFRTPKNIAYDFADKNVLKIAQTAKMVSREKHRMEAFVRFKLTKDDIYFAIVEPDFNVLPLILKHFESRYADQKWIIYDKKRKYGLYYDLEKTEYIEFEINNSERNNTALFNTSEEEFENLWQQYFTSTNIKSRKNLKLHIQHIPQRYWKYLSEKSSLPN